MSTSDPTVPDQVTRPTNRRWLIATSATLAILTIAAGAFTTGRLSADPRPVDIAAPSDTPTATSTPTPYDDATVDSSARPSPGTGPQVFTGATLTSEHPATAPGWGLDGTATDPQGTLSTFAASLHVSGQETHADYGWTIGDAGEGTPTLTVMADQYGSVSYYNPANSTYGCQYANTCAGLGVPTKDDAIAAFQTALTSAGVDVSGWTFTTESYDGATDLVVNADRTDVPLPTGHWWTGSVSTGGVATLYGYTAAVTDLGDLPLISPLEAVTRLSDARFTDTVTIRYGDGEADLAHSGEGDDAGTLAPPAAPPTPGEPIAWPTTRVELTGWTLTTTQVITRDGAIVFLPAYEFAAAGSATTWTVTAVSEDSLSFS